jgi:glucosyl-3-phosphoglycerate synthase
MTLIKVPERTLRRKSARVSVVIPAHNERDTIADVVLAAHNGLRHLDVPGEVVVSASGCTDDTATVADAAGARVIEAPIGKGAAIMKGVAASDGDVVCLIDGDLEYYGQTPLVALLVEPILQGMADACISDLYWRPIYPDQWLNAFFVPLAGRLFPEILPKVGSTPWSGQRAAVRKHWPTSVPDDFTADLAIVLHWNLHAERLRPVLTDDWFNPIRPKPELLALDYELLARTAIDLGRLNPLDRPRLDAWFKVVQKLVDGYDAERHNPQQYEREILNTSWSELRDQLGGGSSS